jgi:deoxyribodipyrimidine photo-lyase
LTYVNKWIPEFGTDQYPEPIVEHKFARERALHRYKKGLGKL